MKEYDIVLIVEFFRSLTYFFSIIKYLQKNYRIGLYKVSIDKKVLEKHKITQSDFVKKCVELGAELIDDRPIHTRVLLVPQRPYLPEALEDIRNNIHATRRIGALTFAWAGLHDTFLSECDLHKIFVIHKRFLDFLLDHRGDRSLYDHYELVEVGLPYHKYPVFVEFRADYLLAMPTPFSFAHEKDKWDFLETLLCMFKEMEPGDLVVHKPHNATDWDNFSPIRYRRAILILKFIPIIGNFIKPFARLSPKWLETRIERLYTAYLYQKVLERTVSMTKLTPDYNFAMEAFLPGVKKGVIGGLSNTIWGALYYKLPYYNCVDITQQRRDANDRLYKKKDPSQFLELNLKFFSVPFCAGKLEFNNKYFDIIEDRTREADLIKELRKELTSIY